MILSSQLFFEKFFIEKVPSRVRNDRFVIEETELSNGNVEMQLQGAAALFSSLSHSPALNWKYKLTMDIKINNLEISF